MSDNNSLNYVITLRSERPIEGCELSPNAFLQLKGGNLDNSARAKMLDAKPFQYVFSWSKGPKGRLCGNPKCPRGDSYDPVTWSKPMLHGPQLACNICMVAGKHSQDSCFCSAICFKQAWKPHCECHANIELPPVSMKDREPITPLPITTTVAVDETAAGNNNSNNQKQGSINTNSSKQNAISNQNYTTLPDGWVNISTSKEYLPTSSDVGCRLRIEVSAVAVADGEVLSGPIAIFTEPVLQAPSAPPKRNVYTLPGATNAVTAGASRFRLISYNVLAELYATKQQYPYCDSWALSWPYRRTLLLRELEQCDGDIVCLQEVQADYYERDINPFMQQLGYDSVFKHKSRDESPSAYVKVDGCATFWKRNKFIQVENYCIEFNDIARQEIARLGLDDSDARKYMNRLSRDNIAQIVVLEVLKSTTSTILTSNNNRNNQNICITNTHLYSNVQRADVKLWQAMNLIRELRQFITQRDLPLLLCGDFNSEPESAVYEYIMSGLIQSERSELNYYQGGDLGNVRILPDLHLLSHDLALTSVLHSSLGTEPMFTNYTQRFKGTLDYIFYSHTRIRVLAVSTLPDEHELCAVAGEGLPSACYPSDHLLLCCDVALIPSGTGNILNTDMSHNPRINIPSMMRSHHNHSTSNLSSAPHITNNLAMMRAHSSTSNLSTTPTPSTKSMSTGRK